MVPVYQCSVGRSHILLSGNLEIKVCQYLSGTVPGGIGCLESKFHTAGEGDIECVGNHQLLGVS